MSTEVERRESSFQIALAMFVGGLILVSSTALFHGHWWSASLGQLTWVIYTGIQWWKAPS